MSAGKPLVFVDTGLAVSESDLNVWLWTNLNDRLLQDRVVIPFLPYWSLIYVAGAALDFHEWDSHWRELLETEVFDACLRPPAEFRRTPGGWVEGLPVRHTVVTRWCEEFGVPVFRDVESLYEWSSKRA